MKRTIVLVMVLGCSGTPATSTTSSPLVRDNGLTTNGIWENGIWENGIWENGIWENGIWENGIWENGIWENGIWENGIWENGIWENGIWENGIWENGIWENGVFVETNWRAEQLKNNPHAGRLLQYIYSCAIPATISGAPTTTTIGPPEARIALAGSIGLAINEDNTAAWESGRCDQSCQRWISACVLARTNAYGVAIEISMRAPDSAPQRVKDALAVTTDAERDGFPLREGAFYGNLFQVEPITAALDERVFAAKPELFACAGPGSNIPEVTKRFSSSQGDNSVIKVDNVCTSSATQVGACTDIGSNDAVFNCRAGNKAYPEVITVFIRDLIAVCGNAVCEGGELAQCPSDCHPGTWASTYPINLGANFLAYNNYMLDPGRLAFATPDNSVVVAGDARVDVDLGTGVLPKLATDGDAVIAKYSDEGVPLWVRRHEDMRTIALAVSPSGEQYLHVFRRDDPATPASEDGSFLMLRVDAAGDLLDTWPMPQGAQKFAVGANASFVMSDGATIRKYIGSPSGPPIWTHTMAPGATATNLAFDAAGDIVYSQNALQGIGSSRLVKLRGNDGTEIWHVDYPPDRVYPFAVTAGPDGDVYVTGTVRWSYDLGGGEVFHTSQLTYFVAKYDGTTGAFVWDQRCKPNTHCAGGGLRLGFDPSGNLIVSGLFGDINAGDIDLGVGRWNSYKTNDGFVASYATADTLPAGARRLQWAKHLPAVLNGSFYGIDVTTSGRIVVAGGFSGSLGVDDRVVISSIPESENVFDSFVGSFNIPDANDVTPPVIDVAHMPRSLTVQATGATGTDVFFMPPTATDSGFAGTSVSCTPSSLARFAIGTTTVICIATDPLGNASQATFTVTVVDTLPPFVQVTPPSITATGDASGAVVTYALPPDMFRDQVDQAVTVTCVPASGSTFAIGTTPVACNAQDDSGNVSAAATFSVTVTAPAPTYTWSGVLQPINADNSSIFKLGSTVPVKFKLIGASASITNLVANLTVAKISNGIEGTVVEATSSGAADSGNEFRYDASSGQYVFNLSTKTLTAGTYVLRIDMHDGFARSVEISLKK